MPSNLLNSGFVKYFHIAFVSLWYTCDIDVVLVLQMRKLRLHELKFFTELQKNKDSL